MKRKVIATVLTLGLVAACGKKADQGVYGRWGGFPDVRRKEVTARMQIVIENEKVTSVALCSRPGQSEITAEAPAKAKISDKQIEILEKNTIVQSRNGFQCQASIEVGTADYEVKGDQLTLTKDGQRITLNRVR